MNPALPNMPPQHHGRPSGPGPAQGAKGPSRPKIERPVKFFEKFWAWFFITGLLGFVLLLFILFLATGVLNNVNDLRFGPNIRGYTFGGIFMGILSLFFMFLTGWYSLRKRRNVTGATMMMWLWSHVWFGLLALFMRRQGEVLSRTEIAEQVWDMNFDSATNVIDVAIRRLRNKLDAPFDRPFLHTVRGMGYVLESRDE